MSSFQANTSIDHSDGALIDWSTPEIIKNKTYEGDLINNPFDIMELKAANMDPFDLVSNQTPFRKDPPCGNILSPFWEPKVRKIKRSVSLISINNIAKIVEDNYTEYSKDQKVGQSNHDNVSISINGEIIDQLKENSIPKITSENKIENQDINVELITPDFNEEDTEKLTLCNEEEKRQIRKKTRQHIEMLIEKGKKYSRKSIYCTPQRNYQPSLNKTDSYFDKGFILNSSSSISFNITPDSTTDINDNNTSSVSLGFPCLELNSFDLDSLQPQWIEDSFSDSDASVDVQTENSVSRVESTNNNDPVDVKMKALNHIGVIESTLNGCQTVLKSMQDKRIKNKGPCIANIPLQQMVQNYKDGDSKEKSPRGQMQPIASSTPTLGLADETSNKINTSHRSVPMSVESPSSPLNVTKCINRNTCTNMSICQNINKSTLLNTSRLNNLTSKRSNTTIVMFNEVNEKKTVIRKSFQLNKSKSESKIGMIPKPMGLNANKLSGLPVPKRFTMTFKGKENIKPL